MSNDPKKTPNWKSHTGGGGKSPPPNRKRDWQAGSSPQSPKSNGPRSNRGKMIGLLLVGGLLIAGIVFVIELLNPFKPPRMILVGPSAANTTAVPANPYGSNAVHDFERFLSEGKNRPLAGPNPPEAVKKEEWASGLDAGNPKKENGVILYLAMHGAADSEGPYLWLSPPDDVIAPDSYANGRLRIKTVLQRLGQLPPDRPKLLILDATQISHNWVHGVLHNDFARALKALDNDIKAVEGLVVICSSDEDQRSWVSEEWQTSIFAHYMEQVLAGATDDSRVTAAQMFDYVEKHVTGWVMDNRNETQTPIILPKESGKERAKKLQLSNLRASDFRKSKISDESASSAPGASWSVPEALKNAWIRRDEYSDPKRPLPPQFVAPNSWRRYLDLLLRAEFVARAGGDPSRMLALANSLETSFRGNSFADLSSTTNAISMPVALGTTKSEKLSKPAFDKLWDAPDVGVGNKTVVWQNLSSAAQNKDGQSGVTLLQLDVAAHLVESLSTDRDPDEKNLSNAFSVLAAVFGPSSPPPTEAQFLQILHLRLAKTVAEFPTIKRPDTKLIQSAIAMRRRAEKIAIAAGADAPNHPASELVYPWIADVLVEADLQRLRGEDKLFSTSSTDFDDAQKQLTAAGKLYDKLAATADLVRTAIGTRNELMAELPFYAQWVAGLPSNHPTLDALLKQIEALAMESHRLSRVLELANPEKVAELNSSGKADFRKLKDIFNEYVSKLETAELASNWHKIDNVLQVPFLSFSERDRLLTTLRKISNDLNISSGKKPLAPTTPGTADAKAAAQRQGRMAIAILGEKWVDDKTMNDRFTGKKISGYGELKANLMDPPTEWWKTVQYDVGEQLGWHWRELAAEAQRLSAKARGESLKDARIMLSRADALARVMDGMTPLPEGSDPSTLYRKYRLHDFLLGQARRFLDAGWADATDPDRPYAETAAKRFVNDAEKLILPEKAVDSHQRDQLLADVNQFRGEKGDKIRVSLYKIAPVDHMRYLTSDNRTVDAKFTIVPPAAPHQTGFPMLRYAAAGPVTIAPEKQAQRTSISEFVTAPETKSLAVSTVAAVTSSNNAPPSGKIVGELLYRGHTKDPAIMEVTLDDKPGNVWEYIPPTAPPQFTVIGDVQQAGTLVIILDWSKSMGYYQDGPNAGQPRNKYKLATEALENVLSNLHPKAVVALFNSNNNRGIDGSDPLTQVVEKGPNIYSNNAGELASLMKILNSKPNYPNGDVSPVARWVENAIKTRQLFKDTPGAKTLLVLTDGEDNIDNANASNVIMNALKGSGVSLQMVLFQSDEKERKNAIEQYKAIRTANPPGDYQMAEQKDDLIERLNNALRPHLHVEAENRPNQLIFKNERGPMVVLPMKGAIQDWSGPLDGVEYRISANGVEPANLLLETGDRAILELKTIDNKLTLRPFRYTNFVVQGRTDLKKEDDKKEVQLALPKMVVKETQNGRSDLELLMMMDREFPGGPQLSVKKPQFVWFEVRPGVDKPPKMLNVVNANYYPIPTWKVSVPDWPSKTHPLKDSAPPAITAWWLDFFPQAAQIRTRNKDMFPRVEADFHDHDKISIDGEDVKIDSVRFNDENQLEVQLSYKPGPSPVFVRALDLMPNPRFKQHERHTFYEASGKYTARFWLTSDRDRESKFTLEFQSMKQIRESGHKIDLRYPLSPTNVNPIPENQIQGPIEN